METAKRKENGTITKGTILNPAGRKKGTLNKTTAELKNTIKLFVESEMENVDELLSELSAKERLDILCKLIPYCVPKQTELISDNSKEVIITFKD